MNAHQNNSKGAWISYGCKICKIENNFNESFSEQVSKIKTKSCEHFDFKFIFNPEKGNMKYMISFICKKCGKDSIVDLYKSNPDGISCIHYKCIQCNNGDMDFQMILNEEALKEQNKYKNNNRAFNNFNNINNMNNNNYNPMNNINQSMNNMQVIGGNMNLNNMMAFNNINNNFMMNNINMNPNFMNMNLPNNNFCMFNNFNNVNMNNMNNMNNANFMMGNMNLNNGNNMAITNNNINNNQNLNIQNQNINQVQNKETNSIKLKFKTTEGLDYHLLISSLDIVFSEVVCKLLEENKTIDEDKIMGFACNGDQPKWHKTLKENNIDASSIINIYIRS